MSDAASGKTRTIDHSRHISEAKIGKVLPHMEESGRRLGMLPRTKEWKEGIAKALRGIKRSPETKEKIRQAV